MPVFGNLGHHPNLESLDLGLTQITDAGLTELLALKNLKSLSLSGPKITDEGLRPMRGMANLKLLRLYKTRVTRPAADELQEARPQLSVDRK